MTQSDQETARSASVAGGFEELFAELAGLLAPVFTRCDLRSNAEAYVRALLVPGAAGNCWALAQAVGHARPYRLQHLLSGAVWDEDAVRDHVRGFVARHLGAGGVLIFDETGDLKKGTCTAGVGRQYTGTAGRIENAIVAVYATYATAHGHALVDRDLYVQREWFADRERMARAGFEAEHAFATKGQIARDQARRVLDAGLDVAWATGDEVYGRSSELREVFEQHGVGYVFAVGCDFQVTTSGQVKMRADAALHLVEARGWNRRSCGNGSKGRRLYDWAWIATASPRHQLLIRRSIGTGELAYYLAYVPAHYVCSLTDLVKVAGTRWAIEDDFQDAKQAVGLDETQVRGCRAWKRHTALALAAYALLAIASALAKATHPAPVLPDDVDQTAPADCGRTALTVPEIQRLLATTTTRDIPAISDIEFHLAWSDWRRSHQARARWHHYRTRLALTA